MKEATTASNSGSSDAQSKMNVDDGKFTSEKVLTAREKVVLKKIKEVAKSQEEYDALVKKYLGK